MDFETLNKILNAVPALKIGLVGDSCVDIYWEADMCRSELSREVPHHSLPVVEERFSLGAGANVLSNLVALGARDIKYISCTGNDWRNTIFMRLLGEIGVSTSYLAVSDRIVTPAYCKPVRHGISKVRYEDPRIDFINLNTIPEELERQLLLQLEKVAGEVDILVVCDQFTNGCITENMIERINELGKKMPIIVDSRNRAARYHNVIVKPNEVEACQAVDRKNCDTDSLESVFEIAVALEKKNGRPSLITVGDKGAVWCENSVCTHVPAVPVAPPIDFVGAGDSFLSGFALAYCLKLPPETALSFACLVSSVTIKKIGVTGVATPDELRYALQNYLNRNVTNIASHITTAV